MRVGVYFCSCGGIVTERIDAGELARRFARLGEAGYFREVPLACSEEGQAEMANDLAAERPDRVVVAACSPREHEATFRAVAERAGLNPFLVQMTNVREHVGWVTADPAAATDKAWHLVRGAVARVRRQAPLARERRPLNTDALVIGGGPAGLKAALTLAEAGRSVVLLERKPMLGGMPVLYEEIFPRLECAPCALEPLIAAVLHGPLAPQIDVLLQAEVVSVRGSFGNFEVTCRRSPRFVRLDRCTGCGECIAACPDSMPSEVDGALRERKAMDLVFFGALPNAPWLDPRGCRRFTAGRECAACRDACPVPGAVDLDAVEGREARHVGGIVVATGGGLLDPGCLPALGHARVPGVVTSLELERLLAQNGPTMGLPRLPGREPPRRVAFVHCAGSLDPAQREYCSGICCLGALKLSHLVAQRCEGVARTHYHRELVVPGKDEAALLAKVAGAPGVRFVPYGDAGAIAVETGRGGGPAVRVGGRLEEHDLVVLMTASVPAPGADALGDALDLARDRFGFFEVAERCVGATSSRVRGVQVAGACAEPMSLPRAVTEGAGAAGALLAALVPGREIEIDAQHARVDEERCSGCRCCVAVCPYGAVGFDEGRGVARVDAALCLACGTCVATCPGGVMTALGFTDEQVFAEIEGVLA